jgi:hypothetical protein
MAALLAAALMGICAVEKASADPYFWTPAQIQDLVDVTAGFHGGAGQLSTIDSITPIANGIELGVTYRIGQDADPFAPNYGLTFARVSLQGGFGVPSIDLSAFTGSALMITTTTDLTAQSFLQTDFSENGTTIDDGDFDPTEFFTFLFWEHNDGVGAGGPAEVEFDFSQGTEFDGNWEVLNPQPVQGTNNIRAWGIQLGKFSGMTIGEPLSATIRIESIPEPVTSLLVGLTAACALMVRRRRNRA